LRLSLKKAALFCLKKKEKPKMKNLPIEFFINEINSALKQFNDGAICDYELINFVCEKTIQAAKTDWYKESKKHLDMMIFNAKLDIELIKLLENIK
jgi:hypothetical protein